MFCMKCGTELPEGAGFCYKCGTPITGAEATPQQPKSAQPRTNTTVKKQPQAAPQAQRQPAKKPEPTPATRREHPLPTRGTQSEQPRRISSGGKFSKQEEKPAMSFGSLVWGLIKAAGKGFLIAFLLIVALEQFDPYNNVLGIDEMRKAYQYTQEVIADQLPNPDTAAFPEFDLDLIQRNGKLTVEGYEYDSYLIYSYVTGKNESGRSGRYEYQIVIGLPNDSENNNFYYEILELK